MGNTIHIKTLSEMFRYTEMEVPKHPLIAFTDFSKSKIPTEILPIKVTTEFYMISQKRENEKGRLKYGRTDYDLTEASLLCMVPEQLNFMTGIEENVNAEGWGLYFHPDLFRSSFLNDKIRDYTFFSYDVNEALHLSDKEKKHYTQ